MPLAASSDSGSTALGFVLIIIGIAAYWVPTIVALSRRPKPPNLGSIVVLNLFLGWSIIGWVIALMMAVRSRPQQPQYVMPPQGWQPPPPQPWQPPSGPQHPQVPQEPYGQQAPPRPLPRREPGPYGNPPTAPRQQPPWDQQP